MKKWSFYTTNEIKPLGWLHRQLTLQSQSLNGNLDKIWPDVRDSAWIGGTAEGWERVPYWLDGFIPLAYLLEDDDMIARAKKYIDAILRQQQPSGWICPCREEDIPGYDKWAVHLIAKVLVVYYECSGDERIPDVVYRVLKNYYELLSAGKTHLASWAQSRWYEVFIPLNFLYARQPEAWMRDLAKIIRDQGTHYDQLTHLWKRPLNKWTFDTHIVNIAMMLKYEAVSFELLGEAYQDMAEKLHRFLTLYNGTVTGTYTGDECLGGLSAIRGTELCAIVEQMYSLEWLFASTGESKWAERLEELAFNALPATISDDMWAHQYVQMSNQISCQTFPGKSLFGTNGPESHLFGLEPNFGCCTANFGQGWPKLALAAFMHDDDCILNVLPLPSQLDTENVHITLSTDYPFRNQFHYAVKAEKPFVLKVRIPSWAKHLQVNSQCCEAQSELTFSLPAGKSQLTLSYDAEVYLVNRPYDLKAAKRGSLIFSLPIRYEKVMHEYVRDNVERKYPYCDWEYVGHDKWNYGFVSDQFEVEERPISDMPFSSQQPALVLKTAMAQVPWALEEGYETVCARVPASHHAIAPVENKVLYPYGCAKLRMTEMPLLQSLCPTIPGKED